MDKVKNSKVVYPALKDFTKFLSEFHLRYYKNLPCNIKGRDLYNMWEKDSTCDVFGTQLEFTEVGGYSLTEHKSHRYLAIDILHRQNGLVKGNFRFISFFLFKSKIGPTNNYSYYYDDGIGDQRNYSKMALGELQVENHFLAAVYNIVDDHFKHSKRWKHLPVKLKWEFSEFTDDRVYEIGLYSPYGAIVVGLYEDRLVCCFGGWGSSTLKYPKSQDPRYQIIELSDPNMTSDLGQIISDFYWDNIKYGNRL